MVFVGVNGAPDTQWTTIPFVTNVDTTPVIREKPYLTFSGSHYSVQVPRLSSRPRSGHSWSAGTSSSSTIPIDRFFIAHAGALDATADSLNVKLDQGYHLILTPGVYHLDKSLIVKHENTVVLGLGMATLIPDYGTPALTILDVDGVSVSGLIFDAGPQQSPSLLIVGDSIVGGGADHKANPTALFDCSARVGPGKRAASNCFTINSNDVILDNIWLWRADHGRLGTHDPSVIGWDVNPAQNGLTV